LKHIVYGNGESRQLLNQSDWITTWGCNAIYRDFSVDNLVSVDYNMQQEIYESGYVMKHKCWFSDWEVLPAEFDPHTLLIDNDGPVYETAKLNRKSCVVQGKDKSMVQKKIEEILIYNPQLDPKDFTKKAMFNVGMYITWVDEYNDKVINIDYPRGWSAGNTALYLACKDGAKEVYMCGFDGSNYAEPINNIYKGSENYLPADSRGYNTINWDNQFKLVQRDFPNVKFFKVGTDLTYEELQNNIR
tara:strand:+ start:883 stop:1617 length:735 start_codon:yes stop_codon:yes gene_type:complete